MQVGWIPAAAPAAASAVADHVAAERLIWNSSITRYISGRAFFLSTAKSGSSQCFSGQKLVYLKTIAVENVVGHI